MSKPRLLVATVLAGGLLLTASPALAQILISDGWSASDDDRAFGTGDTIDPVTGMVIVLPNAYPPLISGIPAPDMLYQIEGTPDTGARVANLHDAAALPWLDEGRTPLVAKTMVDDVGASWMSQQHIISLPAGCSDTAADMGGCVHPQVVEGLVDLAAPVGTPVGPPPFADTFGSGTFASTGVTDRDGTIFSFAGGATVGTDVRIRDDDTIVVRGDAVVGDGLGGRLRGYDAFVLEIPSDGSQVVWPLDWGQLPSRAATVRDSGARQDQPNRRVIACPASRQGYVVSQFLVSGLGGNVGPAVDPALEGGVPVLVSEIIPFDCGPLRIASGPDVGPGAGPDAAFACGWIRSIHQPFSSRQNGRTVNNNSSLAQRFAIVTIGVPPGTEAFLNARVGGANGGEIYSAGLEGVQLDSAMHPDATVWLGQSRVGIDTYGPKPFREMQLTAGQHNFDLLDQQRSLFGDSFDVGPSQKAVTGCPGFDFTAEGVPALFPDGFESGDVSAWQPASAD